MINLNAIEEKRLIKLVLFSFLIMILGFTVAYAINVAKTDKLQKELHRMDRDYKELFDQAEKYKKNIQTSKAADIGYAIAIAEKRHSLEPGLLYGLVAAESYFQWWVISTANCRGLTQLSADKLADWQNVYKNIEVGAAYLAALRDRFGNVDMALYGYNAGPNHPRKHIISRGYARTVRWYQKTIGGSENK